MKEDRGAKTLRAAATEITEHYVEAIMQLRKQCKEVKAKYDALAADDKVKEAIDEVNKTESPKGKLGPSNDFAMLDRNLKKLEGSVASETIQMRRDDGDMWTVSVTFNGQHSADLTIDTGSSSICLPYKVAGEVGLTASATDPTSLACWPTATLSSASWSTPRRCGWASSPWTTSSAGSCRRTVRRPARMLGQSFLETFHLPHR